MWYTTAQFGVPPAQFDQRCKQLIRQNPFFAKMFKAFGVDVKELWQLRFVVGKLDKKHAEFQGDKIVMSDEFLAKHGLANSMFLIAHELVHWLTHEKEKENYFSDPEEVEGFDWAIAYEIAAGKPWDQIEAAFMPLVQIHFNNEQAARQFLISRFKAARNLIRN